MTGRVRVSVEDDTIVVTLAGTGHRVAYRKTSKNPWLVVSDIRDDPNSPIDRYEFRAQAWTAANDKARELGWIV